jgi:hypothetical protein
VSIIIATYGQCGNYDDPHNQPAILFQPVRASVVTVSTFLATTSQFTNGFASVSATASVI